MVLSGTASYQERSTILLAKFCSQERSTRLLAKSCSQERSTRSLGKSEEDQGGRVGEPSVWADRPKKNEHWKCANHFTQIVIFSEIPKNT